MSDYKQTNDEVIERLRDWPFMGKAMATAAADHIEQLAAINEALIAERDEAWRRAGHAEKMWGETEVKLAKAVEVAEKSIKWLRLYGAGVHREAVALKKLTGGKDA